MGDVRHRLRAASVRRHLAARTVLQHRRAEREPAPMGAPAGADDLHRDRRVLGGRRACVVVAGLRGEAAAGRDRGGNGGAGRPRRGAVLYQGLRVLPSGGRPGRRTGAGPHPCRRPHDGPGDRGPHHQGP